MAACAGEHDKIVVIGHGTGKCRWPGLGQCPWLGLAWLGLGKAWLGLAWAVCPWPGLGKCPWPGVGKCPWLGLGKCGLAWARPGSSHARHGQVCLYGRLGWCRVLMTCACHTNELRVCSKPCACAFLDLAGCTGAWFGAPWKVVCSRGTRYSKLL